MNVLDEDNKIVESKFSVHGPFLE